MPNEPQKQPTQKPSASSQGDTGKVGFGNDKAKPIAEKNAKDGTCSTSSNKSSECSTNKASNA